MAYNTEVFEIALQEKGYVIEKVKYSAPHEVKSVFGAVVEGTLVKQVWWNNEGKCFSFKGKALPKYDLLLNEIEKQSTDKN